MNAPVKTLRPTVAGLIVGRINQATGYPPVLLVWPAGAARRHEGNLASVQGGIYPTENVLDALQRELYEECGLVAQGCWYIDHPRFAVPDKGKEYVWGLVQCDHTASLNIDPTEVAAADWYFCPKMLSAGVRQMSSSKALMFKQVFALACSQYPTLMGKYVQHVARIKRRHRQKVQHETRRQLELAMA